MKQKILLIMSMILLVGCSKTTNEKPVLEFKNSRVQISRDSEVDYLSYLLTAKDNEDGDLKSKVKYKTIDSSQVGSNQIEYSLKDTDGNEVKKILKVDIVDFYENNIYSPLDVTADIVKNPEDVTVLINKVNQIPEGWKPNDLESVIDSQYMMLRKEANAAYSKFYQAAKDKGIEIYSISAYRENEKQELFWNNQVKVYGEEYASQYSAYPGRSEHQLGLAIDVSYKKTGDRLSESVATSPVGEFIESDAYKYGFILRYPKDKVAITNYGYEPWHIRYVGVDLATKLHKEKITLEEYYK